MLQLLFSWDHCRHAGHVNYYTSHLFCIIIVTGATVLLWNSSCAIFNTSIDGMELLWCQHCILKCRFCCVRVDILNNSVAVAHVTMHTTKWLDWVHAASSWWFTDKRGIDHVSLHRMFVTQGLVGTEIQIYRPRKEKYDLRFVVFLVCSD